MENRVRVEVKAPRCIGCVSRSGRYFTWWEFEISRLASIELCLSLPGASRFTWRRANARVRYGHSNELL
jgi:hypothetical protein